MKKAILVYSSLVILFLGAIGVTYAAFTDKAKLLGSTFSTGSADIKFLLDLAGGVLAANLTDEKPGPSFSNITPNWNQDYPMKIYNNSASPLNLTTNSNYSTINDPDDLRSYIYVEPFEWTDADNNGLFTESERGVSLGRKTITKWKTEGIDLGQVSGGSVKAVVLKFSTDALSDTKQGKSALFDFEFNSIGL